MAQLFGLGGLYSTYKPRRPASSASVNNIKGSKCWKPDGEQPPLMGVEVRMARATRISPLLATI